LRDFTSIELFNIKFKCSNPNKAHPCVISRLLSYRV